MIQHFALVLLVLLYTAVVIGYRAIVGLRNGRMELIDFNCLNAGFMNFNLFCTNEFLH